MGQFYTSFTEYVVNAQPADWDEEWTTGNKSATVRDVTDPDFPAGTSDAQALQIESTSVSDDFYMLSWDDIGSAATDVDIQARVRYAQTGFIDPSGIWIGVRGSAIGAYLVALRGATTTQWTLLKVDDTRTSGTTLDTANGGTSGNTWYRVRLQATGTTIRGKVWADGDPEPPAWGASATDATFASGWIGFGGYESASGGAWFDWIGVGTNGDDAPVTDPNMQTIEPTGIASSEAFGTTAVAAGDSNNIMPAGIPSGEAFGVPQISLAGSDTVTVQVAAGGDDWYVDNGGTFRGTLNNVVLGVSADTNTRGGFRFDNVAVPQGATIQTVTFLRITSVAESAAPPEVELRAVDADDPTAPTTTGQHDGLVETTAFADWDIPALTAGNEFESVSLATVIQEVVDRPGWASGNAIIVTFDQTVTGDTAAAVAFDDVPANAAELVIAFALPPLAQTIAPTGIPSSEAFGTPTFDPDAVSIAPTGIASGEAFGTPAVALTQFAINQFVAVGEDDAYSLSSAFSAIGDGLFVGDRTSVNFDYGSAIRFADLPIPPGALIVQARLRLVPIVQNGSIPATMLRTEAADNPAAVTSKVDFDGRARTTASVNWTPASWPIAESIYSPDLSTIVQSIIDRPGWQSGNAMQFFWEDVNVGWGGVEARIGIAAFEHTTSNPAALEITYTIPVEDPQPVSGDTGLPLVTFSHTSEITVPIPCRVEWAHPAHGAAGQFSATIPYDYAAASDAYIRPRGGSLVRVASQSGSGPWRGIVYATEYREEGITVRAIQEHVILGYVPVPSDLRLTGVSVATVAYLALQAAGVPIAGVADHGPIISAHSFHGETVWSVLEDMMRRSGAELTFDDDGLANWSGPTGNGYDGVLLAPGQFRAWSYSVNILDQVSRVTAISDTNSISRINPNAAALANWPAHAVIKAQVTHPSDLVILADSELGRRQDPLIGISGAVPRDYWDIQTGQHVTVLLPKAEFSGVLAQARVLSRAIDERGELMTLRLVWVGDGASDELLPRQDSLPRQVRDLQRRVQRGRVYLGSNA